MKSSWTSCLKFPRQKTNLLILLFSTFRGGECAASVNPYDLIFGMINICLLYLIPAKFRLNWYPGTWLPDAIERPKKFLLINVCIGGTPSGHIKNFVYFLKIIFFKIFLKTVENDNYRYSCMLYENIWLKYKISKYKMI